MNPGAAPPASRRPAPSLPVRTAPAVSRPGPGCTCDLPGPTSRPRSSRRRDRRRAPSRPRAGSAPAATDVPGPTRTAPDVPRRDPSAVSSPSRSATVERLSPVIAVSSERERDPEKWIRSSTAPRLWRRTSSVATPRRRPRPGSPMGVPRRPQGLLGTPSYRPVCTPASADPHRVCRTRSSGDPRPGAGYRSTSEWCNMSPPMVAARCRSPVPLARRSLLLRGPANCAIVCRRLGFGASEAGSRCRYIGG